MVDASEGGSWSRGVDFVGCGDHRVARLRYRVEECISSSTMTSNGTQQRIVGFVALAALNIRPESTFIRWLAATDRLDRRPNVPAFNRAASHWITGNALATYLTWSCR